MKMDKHELLELANKIGGLPATDSGDPLDDNIVIALVTYFESREDKPDDSPIDDQVGWSEWAIEKANDALFRIVKYLSEAMGEGR